MTWQVMGLGRKVHREQLDAGLPDDLARAFHRLSEWAHTLPERFGQRVTLRLVDVASIEGFFKSLRHRVGRYPAFVVEGKRYVGSDFTHVDALIAESLATRNEKTWSGDSGVKGGERRQRGSGGELPIVKPEEDGA